MKRYLSRSPRLLILFNALVGWVISEVQALDQPEGQTDQVLSPYFIVPDDPENRTGESLPLKSTKVAVQISGTIANVEIRQTYQNRGQSTLEAIYVFPGSTRAAVHGMTMQVGDRLIEAMIQEKQKAQETYEKAKADNKTASLLQQKRPNVFQMNVANILPGDVIEVTLNYTENLIPNERIYEFVYPTVVGPRYSNTPVADASPDESWVQNPYLAGEIETPSTFDIKLEVAAGMPLQSLACDTHETKIAYTDTGTADVTLADPAADNGDRDFILRYRLADENVATGLLLHRDEALKENFFLMTVQPPKRVTPEKIPGREYIFVVDVSGSMTGFPLTTTKTLMTDLISGLRKTDSFNVMKFASSSDSFSPVSLPATQRNLDDAIRWIDSTHAGGGTEMVKALKKAFDLPSDENISRSLIVVTDGYVSFEPEAFDLIRDNLNRANLFAFGIGSSVNRHLIEGMAHVGRGEPFIVTEPRFAPREAEKLRQYISAPVLTEVKIDFGGLDVYDVEPKTIPDAMSDRAITVFGKWRGKPKGEIKVTGNTGDGPIEMIVEAEDPDEVVHPALPFLWARDRIRTLADYRGLSNRGHENHELKSQITNLGLTYGLLTEFTSFVAVDTEVRKNPLGEETLTMKQPLPMPRGASTSAVAGGSTPEPGFILLLLAGAAGFFGKKCQGRRSAEG